MFSILMLSNKNRCSRCFKSFYRKSVSKFTENLHFTENLLQSLQKIYILQKICFKVKVWKTFKVSTDCRIKPFPFLKRGATLKIPRIVFQRDLCSFCWLQKETPKDNNFPISRIHWRLLAILETSIKSV